MPEVQVVMVKKPADTLWELKPLAADMSVTGLAADTEYQARLAGPQADLRTLQSTAQLAITAEISPNPLQSGNPASITFSIAPEFVSGSTNIRLIDSGDGLTYNFTAPDFGTVQINATEVGYEPFRQDYNVDTQVIEPIVAPTLTLAYAGQTASSIPNINTLLQASNYTRIGRTINPPQLRKNGQAMNLSTPFVKGDVLDILVTDSLGGSRVFPLGTAQYAVELKPLDGGLYRTIDDNPILPDDLLFPVKYAGITTMTSQARLATGPESHKHVTINKADNVYTATPGWWFSRVAGTTTRTYQWLKNGTPIPGATGLTLTHIADFDGATISVQEIATDASGSRTRASDGISNGDTTAPVLSAGTHNTTTNAYGYTTTKPGTLYWAAYVSGEPAPTVNNQGIWAGDFEQVGSLTVQTAGAKTFTPAVTSTQANRLTWAIVDAAGNISNYLDLAYTQSQTTEAAKLPVMLATYPNNLNTQPGLVENMDIGSPDPRRDIVFFVAVALGNGVKPTGLTATAGGQTVEAEPLVVRGSNETTTHLAAGAFYKARLPLGNTVTAEIPFAPGRSSAFAVTIFRGINIDIADVFSNNVFETVEGGASKIEFDLTPLVSGRTLIAGAAGGDTAGFNWLGATELTEETVTSATGTLRRLSLATALLGSGSHSVAITRTSGTAQSVLVGFTVGASE